MVTDLSHLSDSICDKARREANEQIRLNEIARDKKRKAFVESFLKPEDYTLNADGTYSICGWIWQLRTNGDDKCYLSLNEWLPCPEIPNKANTYRGIPITAHYVGSTLQLGQALNAIDEQIAIINEAYPRTLWGRIKLWIVTH